MRPEAEFGNYMGLFDNVLKSGESLFKNEESLDPEWVPKLLPYREQQQHLIASCIKPLLQNRNGKNILIHGSPGIGKTAATKWVLRDLEENTEDIIALYINCWQKNTSYKILVDICEQLGYKFIQNKKTEELFDIAKSILNKKAAVLTFDEIDKLEEQDIIYFVLNDVYKKSLVLITNYKEWLESIEDRIKSRLLPEVVEFKHYNLQETEAILKQRIEYAFQQNVWEPAAIRLIVEKSSELKDIRVGLHLLREAGLLAEEKSLKKIILENSIDAIKKIDSMKKIDEHIEQDDNLIIEIVQNAESIKIGDLFKEYQLKGGAAAYKTFQRRIERLEKAKFIKTNKQIGGKEGTTTIITYEKTKNLIDY